jgi:hypothetical protein
MTFSSLVCLSSGYSLAENCDSTWPNIEGLCRLLNVRNPGEAQTDTNAAHSGRLIYRKGCWINR